MTSAGQLRPTATSSPHRAAFLLSENELLTMRRSNDILASSGKILQIMGNGYEGVTQRDIKYPFNILKRTPPEVMPRHGQLPA